MYQGQSPEGGGMLRELFSRTDLGTQEKKAREEGRGEVITWTGYYEEQLQATSIFKKKNTR